MVIGWVSSFHMRYCRNIDQEFVAELGVIGISVWRLNFLTVCCEDPSGARIIECRQGDMPRCRGQSFACQLVGDLLVEATVLRQSTLAILQRKPSRTDAQKTHEEIAIWLGARTTFNGSTHGCAGHVLGKKTSEGLRRRF